ncbi:MAG: universal stress protein [Desulfobacteraceae bacterium]|jgi:nucleotide-binding universal stress UspA family protein
MRIHIRRILCTTDFSVCSGDTVPYAAAMAKEYGAELFVCHVVDLPPASSFGETLLDPEVYWADSLREAGERMETLMQGVPVAWEPLVLGGSVAESVARIAEEKEVDLVVTATHGRSGLQRLFLGSVSEKLMRILPCPLLVTRSPEPETPRQVNEPIRFDRILVGCDFSPDSELAFRHALSLAQEFQSEIHMAHVIEPQAYRDLTHPSASSDEARSGLRDELEEKLYAMIPGEALNWCEPRTVLLAGQPYEELVKYAVLHKLDLMTLGFRGRGLVETLLVGSTTARVVRQAPCPVLSVRPRLVPL